MQLQHTNAPLHLIFVVLALVFFGVAAFAWPPPWEPWRARFGWAGLFFLTLSTFFA